MAIVSKNSKNQPITIFSDDITDISDMGDVFQSNNIYNRKDIRWYDRFNRFGCLDPFNAVTNTREYLFFTKPDLHILEPNTYNLNPELSNQPYFIELFNRYPETINQLQFSAGLQRYPFMNILSNSVKNTLDMPEITTDDTDTSATIYGTSITYRGDGWSSDEAHEFSLEFEDTRYLEVYQLFKAYDEYERLKRMGIVTPPDIYQIPKVNGVSYNPYLKNKELHDQFGVYKIIVDEDYQTILYYAYLCGVYPKTVPRESFSDIRVDNGLRHTVSFRAQFVDDMKPYILINLNRLVQQNIFGENSAPNYVEVYNSNTKMIDGRWATAPYIVKVSQNAYEQWLGPSRMKYNYLLKWRI